MRKNQKKKLLDCVDSLHEAHKEIKETMQRKAYAIVQNILADCQELAIAIGEGIEQSEGAGCVTVSFVEAYCEALFCVSEEIRCKQETGKSNFSENNINENKVCKILNKQLIKMENSIKNDITVRLEMAFFPYKASMWDSLESVYLAAKEDPDCDAYCVPVPYFDVKPEHSLGQMHYEGGDYPENIQITDWQTYNFEERKPDVIFIHNPYDNCNLVTSVHPRYYSSNLKKYTDTLVYIPYYVTTGGMLKVQNMLPAYQYVDYIMIQSPQLRECFNKNIPNEKFLPFGSPKIDRVINKCKNPPEPPAEWIPKMTGTTGKRKKVFFYNTSISGMLADTESFLKKMKYVFTCFEGREDVCLLWRPHPLLETTFASMRPQYHQDYEELKAYFLDNGLGILDTTPDISASVVISDVYIGDVGTSVTSLFGVVGKPIYILNKRIFESLGEDGWREEINLRLDYLSQNRFIVAQGNKLYASEKEEYDYHYFCDLPDNIHEREYYVVLQIGKKIYACLTCTQDILEIGNEGVEKWIHLEKRAVTEQAFISAYKYDRFLVLQPFNYPAIVCYDTIAEECIYYENNDTHKNNWKIWGPSLIHQGSLYIASQTENIVYKLDIESGETQFLTIPIKSRCGCDMLVEYMDQIWILPYEGREIVRWNPQTGEAKEYAGFPEEFICINPKLNQECEKMPFSSMAFYEDYIYLTPRWANMYLRLNIHTEQFTKWVPPFEDRIEEKRMIWNKSFFLQKQPENERGWIKIYSNVNKKLYNVNMKTNECEEIKIKINMKDIENNEKGFGECLGMLKYACTENAFNSLVRFIDGTTVGNPFDKKKQLEAYKEIAVNSDGSCGRKIYEYIKTQD